MGDNVLLIHSDDTDGSTTFVDSSPSEHSVVAHGDVHHETDEHKFGASAIYFDGSGDYLSLSTSDDWDFGTDDFTIDWWFNPDTVSGDDGMFALRQNTSTLLTARCGGGSPLVIRVNGATISSSTPEPGTWYHLALVRYLNDLTAYLGGTSIGSEGVSGVSFSDGGTGIWIGQYYSASYPFKGYIDEFRILKGEAAWTSNFTPPTSPYGSETALIDASLDLSAYYRSLDDFGSFLRAHDGLELRDLQGALEAAGWNLEDFAGFLSAYYESLENAGMVLETWKTHYDDPKLLLAAWLQNLEDAGVNLETWATSYSDFKPMLEAADWSTDDLETWLGAWAQNLSSFSAFLRAGKHGLKDLAVFLSAVNGTIMNDLGAFLFVTDGVFFSNFGMGLQAISAAPTFRTITAQRVGSVIHEVA